MLKRLLIAVSLVFFAMSSAWSLGAFVRTNGTRDLLVGILTGAVTLVLAWLLRRSARR